MQVLQRLEDRSENTLNSVGFKNGWVMAAGFCGRKGGRGAASEQSPTTSVVIVVKPSWVIPAAVVL
jgi:hypothetical protein